MISRVRGSILIFSYFVCVWIEFGVMLNIEVSVKATFMMSLLAEVLILIALGAVQTTMGTNRQKQLPIGLM